MKPGPKKGPEKHPFTTRHEDIARVKRLTLQAHNPDPGKMPSYSKGMEAILDFYEAHLTEFLRWRDEK